MYEPLNLSNSWFAHPTERMRIAFVILVETKIHFMMRKKHVLMVICLMGALSTAACKKCQTCESQGQEVEVCRDDYGSQQLYDAYIISLENNGWDCK